MRKNEDKTIAIISYFSIFGSIIALIMNSEKKYPFASFHNRQALGLNLLFFAMGYPIGYFDSWLVTSAFYVAFIVLWLFGFAAALQYEAKIVPIVGHFFQRIFKSI